MSISMGSISVSDLKWHTEGREGAGVWRESEERYRDIERFGEGEEKEGNCNGKYDRMVNHHFARLILSPYGNKACFIQTIY